MLTYWSGLDADGKREFASRAETIVPYLSQIAHGHKTPSAEMAKRLHQASNGQIALYKLRPDLWAPGEIAA